MGHALDDPVPAPVHAFPVDFTHVSDVARALELAADHELTGIYNLGTGQARTFLDLARQVFHSLDREPQISYIDTPIDIRANYQYFTEAKMERLRQIGYTEPFFSLEKGVDDYVRNYLRRRRYF